MDAVDEKGNELKVGDRIYCPARPWHIRSSLTTKPCYTDAGEESLRPSVRGRIVAIGYSEKWDATWLEVRVERCNYTKFAWADLSRKQKGRTMKEKEQARFAEINAAREEINQKPAKKKRAIKRKGVK